MLKDAGEEVTPLGPVPSARGGSEEIAKQLTRRSDKHRELWESREGA